jgi:hypothetical protein
MMGESAVSGGGFESYFRMNGSVLKATFLPVIYARLV